MGQTPTRGYQVKITSEILLFCHGRNARREVSRKIDTISVLLEGIGHAFICIHHTNQLIHLNMFLKTGK